MQSPMPSPAGTTVASPGMPVEAAVLSRSLTTARSTPRAAARHWARAAWSLPVRSRSPPVAAIAIATPETTSTTSRAMR